MRYSLLLVLGLALAACAPAPPPAPPPPPPPAALPPPPTAAAPARTVQTAIGPVLADARGMTLYTFTRDTIGRSNCNGRCAEIWPPFLAAPDARPVGNWSILVRANGSRQWALRGQPLYTYNRDRQPGDVTGQGVRRTWYVARP